MSRNDCEHHPDKAITPEHSLMSIFESTSEGGGRYEIWIKPRAIYQFEENQSIK